MKLKYITLLQTHNPTEFKNWCRLFKGYYRSSNLDLLEVPDQQLYFQACMEPSLFGRIQNKIDDQMTVWEDGGCIDLLLQDFQERWPLFNRRMAFFTSELQQNQDVSAWISVLEELASEAEIESISMEDVMIFRILTGMSNTKIRHELTKLSEPTLKDYKRKVVEMEVARRMESSIDKTRKTIAAVVKGKSGKAG